MRSIRPFGFLATLIIGWGISPAARANPVHAADGTIPVSIRNNPDFADLHVQLQAMANVMGFHTTKDYLKNLPTSHIDDAIDIAHNPNDPRQPAYWQHVQNAITAATESINPPVADLTNATGWKKTPANGESASLRTNFYPLRDVGGNTFFVANAQHQQTTPPHGPGQKADNLEGKSTLEKCVITKRRRWLTPLSGQNCHLSPRAGPHPLAGPERTADAGLGRAENSRLTPLSVSACWRETAGSGQISGW